MTTRSRLAVLPLLALTATGCPESSTDITDISYSVLEPGPTPVGDVAELTVESRSSDRAAYGYVATLDGESLSYVDSTFSGFGPSSGDGQPVVIRPNEDGVRYKWEPNEANAVEVATHRFRCNEVGTFTISGEIDWQNVSSLDEPGEETTREASWNTEVECVEADGSTTTTGTTDPTDDPTDPTDDPTDPTDDPTDPPADAPVFDIYLALDDSTIESYIYTSLGVERSDAEPVSVDVAGFRAAASPSGDVLFVATDDELQSITRDTFTGELFPVQTVETYDGYIATLTVAADGETVLATDLFVDTPAVTKWGINPDGSLGDSFSFVPSEFPGGLVTNPAADTLYVPLDVVPGAIEIFDYYGIDAAPTLRETVDLPEAGRGPAVAGDCLFVSSGGSVHGFPLDADGTPGAVVVSETSGGDVHAMGEQPRVLVDGAFVPEGELAIYDFDDACALTPAGSTPRESWTVISEPVVDGEQAYLVEADDSGDLWVLSIDADGVIDRGELVELPYAPLQLFALRRD